MPIGSGRLLLLGSLTLASVGCLGTHVYYSGLQIPPRTLEQRGEAAFNQYRIPLAERQWDSRVRSGWFRADEAWGRGMAEGRLICGGTQVVDRAPFSVVELSVTLKISSRMDGSRVGLYSDGRALVDEEEDRWMRCQLSEDFANEVLAAVTGWQGLPGTRRMGGFGGATSTP